METMVYAKVLKRVGKDRYIATTDATHCVLDVKCSHVMCSGAPGNEVDQLLKAPNHHLNKGVSVSLTIGEYCNQGKCFKECVMYYPPRSTPLTVDELAVSRKKFKGKRMFHRDCLSARSLMQFASEGGFL